MNIKNSNLFNRYLLITFSLNVVGGLKYEILRSFCYSVCLKSTVLWFLPINGTIAIAVCNSERMMQRIN